MEKIIFSLWNIAESATASKMEQMRLERQESATWTALQSKEKMLVKHLAELRSGTKYRAMLTESDRLVRNRPLMLMPSMININGVI